MTDRTSILFFSRGRGRGHAIPDMAIARELPPAFEVSFASYGTGAKTLRSGGWPVFDLGLPEANKYLPTLLTAQHLIAQQKPDVVVAHEEFAALVAAEIEGVSSVFISAWLPPPGAAIIPESLAYADSIILLEEPGLFPAPTDLRAPPRFVGPFFRKLQYALTDRTAVRRELAIPADAFVVFVLPGGWGTEEKAPLADTVLPAFEALEVRPKALIWAAGEDHRYLSDRMRQLPGAQVLPFTPSIDRYLAASDVVVTKASRGATLDAANLGLPSISISHGLNPVDDYLVPRIPSNTALLARATDGAVLHSYFAKLAAMPLEKRRYEPKPQHGASVAAAALSEEVRRLRAHPKRESSTVRFGSA